MAHPYPTHHERLPYCGRHRYFLTFCTDQRRHVFIDEASVTLVRTQILRAAREERFQISAYCFMPDHVHLIAVGCDNVSDAKAFIKLAKQYSGYFFKRQTGMTLWQRYGFERVIRDDAELAFTIRYIVANPVRDGLVDHPSRYPYIGSEQYSVGELLAICEYEGSSA